MEHKASEIESTISTLRKENGWYSNELCLYQYQGFWYYSAYLKQILSDPHLSHWTSVSPSAILICGHPKCGLTWLKSLAYTIATRTRYQQADNGNPLLHSLPHDLIPYLEFSNVPGYAARDPELPLFSTHMNYSYLPKSMLDCGGCKMLYICRDPKDVFVSLWHFLGTTKSVKDGVEIIPLEQAFDLFCDGVSVHGPYWDHVLGYWKASVEDPTKVLFLKYEDMMNDPLHHAIQIAKFMGYPFSEEEQIEGVPQRIAEFCSFKSLRILEVNRTGEKTTIIGTVATNDRFFRKGKTGDWKNYLTPEMAEKIDDITKKKLSSFALQF